MVLKKALKSQFLKNKSKNLKVKFNSFIEKEIKSIMFYNYEELNNLIDKTNFDFLYLLSFFEVIDQSNLKKLSKFCMLINGDDSFLTVDDWYMIQSKMPSLDYKR